MQKKNLLEISHTLITTSAYASYSHFRVVHPHPASSSPLVPLLPIALATRLRLPHINPFIRPCLPPFFLPPNSSCYQESRPLALCIHCISSLSIRGSNQGPNLHQAIRAKARFRARTLITRELSGSPSRIARRKKKGKETRGARSGGAKPIPRPLNQTPLNSIPELSHPSILPFILSSRIHRLSLPPALSPRSRFFFFSPIPSFYPPFTPTLTTQGPSNSLPSVSG
ncbi:hypothetical protein IE53DRAFT_42012 [Violaceomyces palustris]|uniref:Uncharacterized protein n=1 Tax=Violaceomyces palustris TaxID=1673888 RepID=A0ACD0P0N8_9BASI|nr:hypothetical protein IE53DRAFT_42012 [Violaceomyces palustris]